MKLSDLITPQDDLHKLMHRDEPFPSDEKMQQKALRLKHITEAFRECVKNCGQVNAKCSPDEEVAIMCATMLLLDDAIEYVTEKRKAS